MAIRLIAQHNDHVSDDFVYVNYVELWGTLLVEQADAVDDIGCTPGISHRFQDSFSVCDGCPNWLLDFVRQRGGQLAHRVHAADMRKIRLELAQPVARLFSTLALRDIDHRADHLNKLPSGTQDWMADTMNVFDFSVGLHDSELYVATYFIEECPFISQLQLFAVFWVYSLQPLVEHWWALLRIKTEKSEHFVGPVHGLVACAINGTTTGVGQALRFHQIGFTGPKGFLDMLALSYVHCNTDEFQQFP